MTPVIFFVTVAILILVLIGCYIDNVAYKPKRMTSPPVDKILNLVKGLEGFKIHFGGYSVPSDIAESMMIDWTLEDTKTGKLTWMYEFIMNDHVVMKGDLNWMNVWEQRRLYDLVESIGRAQNKADNAERKAQLEAEADRRREEAKEIYENR